MSDVKKVRRFNPPLKRGTNSPLASQDSSWSLPSTQTHTVLSYCDTQAQQVQDRTGYPGIVQDTGLGTVQDTADPGTVQDTGATGGVQETADQGTTATARGYTALTTRQYNTPAKDRVYRNKLSKRKYNYSMFPHRSVRADHNSNKSKENLTKSHSVYEYQPTPVTPARRRNSRRKEQIEIDKSVLHFIAKTRAEIQAIRNKYLSIKMQRGYPNLIPKYTELEQAQDQEREE